MAVHHRRPKPPNALSIALSLWLVLASWPAAAAIFGGMAGEARTVDGETIPLERIRLRAGNGRAELSFSARPFPPPFQAIQDLSFEPLDEELIGSRPEAMEVFNLGSQRMAVPPPPDWRRSFGTPSWARAHATAQVDHLPFVNGAVFCWAAPESESSGSAQVYLLRQQFNVRDVERVARATLRLAGNGELLEAAINDQPIHLAGQSRIELAEYEIGPLLRPGENLIALRLSERPNDIQRHYGVAFHIELVRRLADNDPPPPGPVDALLISRGGDRLWGSVAGLDPSGIVLDTLWGRWRLAWEEVAGVLLPGGWRPAPPPSPLVGRLLGRSEPPPSLEGHALPVWMNPTALHGSVLLTEGRRANARPVALDGSQIFFEGQDGQAWSVPMAEVLAIYPPRPEAVGHRRPLAEVADIYVQLRTTRGERASGLLVRLDGGGATLETDSGATLHFHPGRIAAIHFPYHGMTATHAAAAIALLPQAGGIEGHRTTYENDIARVQSAAFALGIETTNLELEQLADAGRLTPERYPVLVGVDPLGEYLHTLRTPGDAQEALVRYLEAGGNLVVLARGGVFRTALRVEGGQIRRGPAELTPPSLAEALGLRRLQPGENRLGVGAEAFHRPPNHGHQFFFERAQQVPVGLFGLPGRVRLASLAQAPYYPMVTDAGMAHVLYDLRDESGRVYGPALQVITHGRGRVVLINHLLWESELDGVPFHEHALPKLLGWALM